MAIFRRKKEEREALLDRLAAMSDEELDEFEKEDYAKKEKRAGLAAKIGLGIIGVFALLIAGTAIAWGPALFAIGFIGSVGILGGLATTVGSWIARRNFRTYRKMQELLVQARDGKTSKGRTLSTEKQTSASHKLAKSRERLVKKGYISKRVAEKYSALDGDVADAARRGRPSRAGREAFSAMARANREYVLSDIDTRRNDFVTKDLANFDVDDSIKSKVELRMHKFDKDGNVEYNADGKPMFETVAEYNCNSDVDLLGTCLSINEGLDNDTVFPVIIKVSGSTGQTIVLKDKADWEKHSQEFSDKAVPYLKERYHEPEETHEHEEEHRPPEEEHTM